MSSSRIWAFCELYHPEDVSTGYLLTHIAEGLAETLEVHVVTGPATRGLSPVTAPSEEVRHGVHIHRCRGGQWNRRSLTGRIGNMLVRTWTMFFKGLGMFRRNDLVLVVTNPPLLPFAALLLKWIRGTKFVLLIHDVYPEVLVASKLCRPGSLLVRLGRWANRLLYRQAVRIVCLGRDMERLVQTKLPADDGRVRLIPHWAETDSIVAESRTDSSWLDELGLKDKFVVLYAGNLGRTHGVEDLLVAAEQLRSDPGVHLLVTGYGAGVKTLQSAIAERDLKNISYHPFARPREQQGETLAACDVGLITFMPGMSGVSVPSRMYNVMAAGRPLIAVTDDDSELGRVVREEEIGWVVRPGDGRGLASVVLEARNQPDRVVAMGRRSAEVARTKYTAERTIEGYRRLFEELTGQMSPELVEEQRQAA